MTIRSKKDWWTLLFLAVFIPLIIIRSYRKLYGWTHFKNFEALDISFALLVLIALILTIQQFLWILTGQVIINISNDYLSVDKKIIGITWTKKYEIQNISNIYITDNENSNTYWGKGIRFYDKNIKMLHFSMNGKTISIGNKLEDFDAGKIKHEICSRQK
ncbi:MAG: hypothetical protein IPP56_16745 [Bacteroidetes bacterium]|nr:hypothetical protein [Bacteroidota bacterium]